MLLKNMNFFTSQLRCKYLDNIKKYHYSSTNKYQDVKMNKNLNMTFIFDKVIRNHTTFYLPFIYLPNKLNRNEDRDFNSLVDWLKQKNFDIEVVETFNSRCTFNSKNCKNYNGNDPINKKLQYHKDKLTFNCDDCTIYPLKHILVTTNENSLIEFDDE